MKRNKKFYGLLGAVTALALATPFIGSHIAKADTLYSDVVAWYDFNDGALTNSKGSSQAEAVVVTNQSWSKYTSDLAFGADRDKDNSEGKALQVGDAYGIELNEQNLGDNFSVSLWLKPDSTFDNNQVLVALGYHNPEDWYAISGNANGSDEVKIWCRNPNVAAYNGWYTKATSNISKNDWHHVVITGEGVTHKTYIDGTLVTSSDFTNVLSGENQDIYIAVNNWDKRFSGLVDDVIVYNRTISAGEVERLFTGQTAEQLLEESEITVSDVATSVNRVAVVNVNVPEAVKDDAKLTYDIADKSIATVDKDGNVTGVSKGETTITVTAKLGATEKSATAKVTVESSLKGFLAADYGFDGNITDATGSVESTLYGTKLSDYSGDAVFAEGIEGQALKLSNYGVDLGVRDLGTDFTVSFYVKPLATQAENQIMIQLGYHDPELWTSISGTGADSSFKLWGNTAGATTTGNAVSMGWTTVLSPTIPTDEWSLISLVGTDGKITAYKDGVLIGSGSYNNPLCGTNQGVYLGVNNWDTCFNGLFDNVKVYSVALSQEEIIEDNHDYIVGKLQTSLENTAALSALLGANTSADEIKYDLALPQSIGDTVITWESSDEKIIATDGTVVNPKKDIKVTLKATATLYDISATVTYDFTVLSLDKTELNSLIELAESYDLKYATEVSAERLKTAIAEAKEANTFDTVDESVVKLQKAIAGIVYEDAYLDPFEVISDATVATELAEGKDAVVFAIPDSISTLVDVEYVSNDESTCTYKAGTVKAKKAGKAMVTAIVTAKSDGFTMEYSTAVNVVAKDAVVDNGDSD